MKILKIYENLGLCEESDLRVPRAVTRLTVYRPLGITEHTEEELEIGISTFLQFLPQL